MSSKDRFSKRVQAGVCSDVFYWRERVVTVGVVEQRCRFGFTSLGQRQGISSRSKLALTSTPSTVIWSHLERTCNRYKVNTVFRCFHIVII